MGFDETFEKYVEKFDESFPVRGYPGDMDAMIAEMEKCTRTGTPYTAKYDPDSDY